MVISQAIVAVGSKALALMIGCMLGLSQTLPINKPKTKKPNTARTANEANDANNLLPMINTSYLGVISMFIKPTLSSERMDKISELMKGYAKRNFYFDPARRAKSLERMLSREIVASRETRARLIHFDEGINSEGDMQVIQQSSGSVLSTDGFVLTNHHCLSREEFGLERTIVEYRGMGYLLDPLIYHSDSKSDLLLLRMMIPKHQGSPQLSLAMDDQFDRGVKIMGPDGPEYSIIAACEYGSAEDPIPDRVYLCANGKPGYSGSPILSREESLAGIVYGVISHDKIPIGTREHFIDGTILCAIPASRIRKFITEAICYISSRPKRT